MARKSLKDDLKKRGQAVAEKAQKKAAGETGGSSSSTTPSNSGRSSVRTSAQSGGKRTVNRSKTGSPSVQNTAKKTVSKVKENPKVQEYQKANQAGQRYLDRRRFTDDMAARAAVRYDNIVRGRNLPQKSTGAVKELGLPGKPPAGLSTSDYDRIAKDAQLTQKGYGLDGQAVSYKEIIDASALAPLSALKADSMSYANFGRNKNVKVKEKTDEEKFRDAVERLKSAARKKGAKQQTLSRHDNKLDKTYRDEIKLAKEDFDAADRKYQAAKARGDTAAMERYAKERQQAHEKAETWRRIKGGFSGGKAGNEYIVPEVSAEDEANLNREGLTLLRAAKLGYENAETDEARAMYAAQGQSVRNNPAYQKERFDRGAYRNETGEGRMMYGGTEEERKQEGEQLGAILPAIGTGIAGSFASIPGNVAEALHADAARNQDALQALSDARGGGEVNINEPEKGPTAQEIMADLLNSERYQNASPLVKARLMKYALQDAKDAIPAGERLLAQSERYRQKATEGQKGLEKYLTEALITGGEMAPGLVATALTGGMAAPGLAVMGAQAAGQEMGTLGMQGVDPVERFNRGVLSGAIEAGTELLPLKNLAKIAKGGGDTFAKNLAAQALEEVGTEELSDILQYGADKAFKDPNASLTAQDLKDTAVISLLTSLGMGTGAGMIGSRRMSPMQRQKTTAALDQVTPTADDLMQKAQDLQRRVALWNERDARLRDRLANSAQDPTWHKHLLGEMEQHEAERQQLKQELIGLEMQKAQRAEVDRQKAEQEQETARINQAVDEAMQSVTATPEAVAPVTQAKNVPQEAAQSPVLNPAAEQVTEPAQPQEAVQGQETPRITSTQYGQPENHIDNRQSENLGSRNVKAFQWDHPEIKPFYQKAAQALKEDAEYSDATRQNVRGSKKDQALGRKLGTVMQRNDALNRLYRMGLSTSDIIKACDAIINDQGQENYAAAKRVELALNDMLSKGYIPVEANRNPDAFVGPDAEYLRIKGEISGGVAPGSWEAYRRDHDFVVETGTVTEDELRREWEAEQNQPQPAPEAENIATVFQSMEDELSALYDRANAMIEEAETGAHDQAYYDEQAQRLLDEERAIRAKWAQENQAEEAFSEDSAQESTPETAAQESEEQNAPYSVGAAPGGFDPTSVWQESTDQFHPINQKAIDAEAENWGRAPVDIPVRDPYGQMTSKTASTLINAGMTPNQISDVFTDMVRKGQLSRIPYTDNEAVQEAERIIQENGFQRAKEDWLSEVRAGKMSKDLTTMGIVLYNNAANAGSIVEAIDIATDFIEYGKTAGQVLQAVNIINKLGPAGQLYSLASAMDKLENEIRKRQKKDGAHWDGITIDKNLAKEYMEAQSEEERRSIEKEIKKNIASQIPSTLQDKLDAWRYTAMLGNPLTQERNLAGNLGFQPVRILKNTIGTGLERMAGLDQSQRTKSLQFKAFSKADRARYQAGLDEFDQVESIIMGNGKYNDTFSEIDQYRRIFKSRVLEGWRKLTNAGLEVGDIFFSKRTYADSLAGVLKARGITAQEYTDPSFSKKQKDEIQAIAIIEAQKATYRDINKFSSWVSGLGKGPNTPKAVHYLTEGLLPFKKTPANVLVRGIEYSPIGLIKGIVDMNTKVKRGEMTAAEGIDELASGLTGTGLLGLGVLLGLTGMVSAGADDDEKQSKFDELIGKQNYALNLPGGYSYSLNWLAPEAIPFFMGVEAQKAWKDVRAGEKGKDAIWNAIRRITDPVLEMSMLQGVNDLIENVSYSDNKAMSILATLATGYLTQFVPTIGGQIERTIEDRRYSTWIDRDSAVPSEIQYLLGKTFNKIPGIEYHQREYLNAWSEPEMTGNPLTRALKNFASPGYIKKESDGAVRDVEEELQRLYDAGFDDVFPDLPKTSTKINDMFVSSDVYNAMVKAQGKTSIDLLMDAINSDVYQGMTDADKADYVNKIFDYAKAKGKQAAGEDPEKTPKWISKLDNAAEKYEIGVSALLQNSMRIEKTGDTDGNESIKTEEAWNAIQGMDGSDAEKRAMFDLYNGTKQSYDEYAETAKKNQEKAEKEAAAAEKANEKLGGSASVDLETFQSAVESVGGYNSMSYTEFFDTMDSLNIPEAERSTYYDIVQSYKGHPWKKTYAQAKKAKGR